MVLAQADVVSPARRSPVHLLVVEDSQTAVEVIRNSLEADSRGLRLTVARTLAEAHAAIVWDRPDLAIVDLFLPDGRGIDLLPANREEAQFPIVIMTAQGDEMTAVEVIKAGALDYLVKSPMLLNEIPAVITRTLRTWQLIVEKRQSARALQESEARFRAVFNTAAAGMFILSPEGEILQVNPELCALTGYGEAELIGRHINDITHPADLEKTAAHYDAITAGAGEAFHYEKRYLCKDGRVVWGHASVACVRGTGRQPLYWVGLFQDISERKRMEEELRAANRELDDFVHTVSHNLRTPLTPVIGYAEFLAKVYGEALDDQGRMALSEIANQGHRLLAMLEDLLDLARVGHLQAHAAPVDCHTAVEEVLVGLAAEIAAVGASMQVGPLPACLVPQTLLVQVFDNLLGNAVRYAGEGGKVIEVGGARLGERVRLHVCDHGPGIAEAERDRVFELFYRGAAGRKRGGTGVGLATVQKIARLYGGRAWVEETPGGGCTFYVELVDRKPERS